MSDSSITLSQGRYTEQARELTRVISLFPLSPRLLRQAAVGVAYIDRGLLQRPADVVPLVRLAKTAFLAIDCGDLLAAAGFISRPRLAYAPHESQHVHCTPTESQSLLPYVPECPAADPFNFVLQSKKK